MADNRLLIGYYRLSQSDDGDQESNSITNQRLLIKDYISNTPELAAMPFQEFYDDGYSGASMHRPAMQQILELARENKVQAIVVKDFSRFSRDYIELGTYLEQILPFMGIRFISVTDRYDSKDYRGKASEIDVQFKGLVADIYLKDLSAKVKSSVQAKRTRGEYCCGLAPYGYQRNPENKKKLLIAEEEAAIIRRIFDLTNKRYSKMEICRIFNEEGIPTPLQSMSKRQKVDNRKAASKNLQWTVDMIRKIINDKNYIGCMVYGKTKVQDPGTDKEVAISKDQWKVLENHHEAIVSRDVFDMAQSLQIRHCRKNKVSKSKSLLSGYVKCGNCERNLTGSRDLHGHILYSCSYSSGKEDTGCFAGKADNKILEFYVLGEIKVHLQHLISHEQMDEAMRSQHRKVIQEYQTEIKDCNQKQAQLKDRHRTNYEKYRAGELDQKDFQNAKEQIDVSKEHLKKRVQELEKLIHTEEEILLKKNIPAEQMIEFLGYDTLTREMLKEYVEGIYVHDSGKTEIRWRDVPIS